MPARQPRDVRSFGWGHESAELTPSVKRCFRQGEARLAAFGLMAVQAHFASSFSTITCEV
jgi:hypothetical protein